MKKVETKDGSYTFFSEEFNEHYHSLSGAYEEALKKHVEPVIAFLSDTHEKEIVVLDFCFGLGYNAFVFLKEWKKTPVRVIALENDPEIVNEGRKIFAKEWEEFGSQITLLQGDAEKTLDLVKDKIDVCFFDPFSPKRCPALWTPEIFKKVFALGKENMILTTYSCARVVREAMKEAQFEVADGPIIGRWAPSTLGYKK